MRLTPGQVAELRASKNVRGQTLESGEWQAMFQVSISYDCLTRAQELTLLGRVPSWNLVQAMPSRCDVHTTAPEWFVELEEKINESRRPAHAR
jgi:hypothetical protein